MTTATATMTPEQAAGFRKDHDAQVRLLSRKPKGALAAIYHSEAGFCPGVMSRDELIAGILRRRGFGVVKLNQAIHTLHHDVPWPDCSFCTDGVS